MRTTRLWRVPATVLLCFASFLPLPAQDAQGKTTEAAAAAAGSVPARQTPLSVEELQALFPEALRDEPNQCLTFCLGKARLIAFHDARERIGFIVIQPKSGETDKVASRLASLLQLRDISHKAVGCSLLIDEKLLRKTRLAEGRSLIPAERMSFIDGLLNWDEPSTERADASTSYQVKPDVRFTGWKSSGLSFRIRDSIHGRSISYEIGIIPSEPKVRTLSIRTQTRLSDDEFCDALKKHLRLHGYRNEKVWNRYYDKASLKKLRARTGFSRLLLYNSNHDISVGVVRSGVYGLFQEGAEENRPASARSQPLFPKKVSSWPSEPDKTGPAFAGSHSATPDAPPEKPTQQKEPESPPAESPAPSPAPREELPLLTPRQALQAYIEKLRAL